MYNQNIHRNSMYVNINFTNWNGVITNILSATTRQSNFMESSRLEWMNGQIDVLDVRIRKNGSMGIHDI